jgi:hypothetical protein
VRDDIADEFSTQAFCIYVPLTHCLPRFLVKHATKSEQLQLRGENIGHGVRKVGMQLAALAEVEAKESFQVWAVFLSLRRAAWPS